MSIEVKVKLLNEHAVMPAKAYPGDTGFDLFAPCDFDVRPGHMQLVATGVALELPAGYGATIRSRSSQSKRGLLICGGSATLDSGYRGDVRIVVHNLGGEVYEVKAGDRIAQLVIEQVPEVRLVVVGELGESVRSTRGFGSSGR